MLKIRKTIYYREEKKGLFLILMRYSGLVLLGKAGRMGKFSTDMCHVDCPFGLVYVTLIEIWGCHTYFFSA